MAANSWYPLVQTVKSLTIIAGFVEANKTTRRGVKNRCNPVWDGDIVNQFSIQIKESVDIWWKNVLDHSTWLCA